MTKENHRIIAEEFAKQLKYLPDSIEDHRWYSTLYTDITFNKSPTHWHTRIRVYNTHLEIQNIGFSDKVINNEFHFLDPTSIPKAIEQSNKLIEANYGHTNA